jgi:hypothetical protein
MAKPENGGGKYHLANQQLKAKAASMAKSHQHQREINMARCAGSSVMIGSWRWAGAQVSKESQNEREEMAAA